MWPPVDECTVPTQSRDRHGLAPLAERGNQPFQDVLIVRDVRDLLSEAPDVWCRLEGVIISGHLLGGTHDEGSNRLIVGFDAGGEWFLPRSPQEAAAGEQRDDDDGDRFAHGDST